MEKPLPAGGSSPAQDDPEIAGSEFLERLSTILFASPPPWPKNFTVDQADKARTELAAAFQLLFSMHAELRPPKPRPKKNSAADIVRKLIKATKWTTDPLDGGSAIPPVWNHSSDTYRLFEIAGAMTLFMKAFNASGGGGDPSNWPPQRPT